MSISLHFQSESFPQINDNIMIDDDQGSGVELELADARSLQWEEIFVQTVLNDTHQVLLLIMWGEIFVWEEIFNERNFLSTPSFMTLTRFDF